MSSPAPRTPLDKLSTPISASQSSEYPFPQYESPSKASPNDRYRPRRGSTASSLNTIGGVLDTSIQGRNPALRESGQNAISTLLQPPIVRTGLLPHTSAPASSAHKPPSAKDIPPVALTNIPHIDTAAFKPYLIQIGSLYDAFQRAKEGGDEGEAPLFGRSKDTSKADEFADILGRDARKGKQPASPYASRRGSVASLLSPLESPLPKRRPSGGGSRKGIYTVTPLSTIPNVYFDKDFHLENPRTFDVVSERSEVVRPVPGTPIDERKGANGSVSTPTGSGRKALATNAILQEKLSWYMDTVEIHLISSISSASTSFFAALGSLRELHHEAAESVAKIKGLRDDLHRLDKDMAVGGLKVVSMRRRRENMRKLGEAVEQLRMIVNGVARCEGLVDDGDIERALNAVDGLEQLIAGEEGAEALVYDDEEKPAALTGKLLDLRGVHALEGVTNDLDLLRSRIGKAFELRFLDALLGDLRHHIDTVPPRDTLQRWGTASQRSRGEHNRTASAFPAYLNLDHALRSKLLSNLQGLSRSKYTMPGTTAYRDAVLREVKTLIRRHLPSSDDEDNESMMSASTHSGRQLSQQEKSSILARNLRAMDPADAEDMLIKTYSGVGEALRRLGIQVKVLLDLTSGIGSPRGLTGMKSPPKSPNLHAIDGYLGVKGSSLAPPSIRLQEEIHQALDMSSLLGQAVDIAQTQITKVLKVRTEQTVHLPLSHFLRYFTLNRLFADECEAVSGRGGTVLKNVVNGQIKEFVIQLGENERQTLAHSMETDHWDAKDFGDSEDALLSRVLEGMTKDAPAWIRGNQVWLDDSGGGDTPSVNGTDTNGTAGTSSRDRVRQAVIEGNKYILPEPAISVLRGVEKFENLIIGIPSMTAEIVTNLLDYLKLFNSRSSQLILGAGATRTAGLKNITTKHLALASQALSFIIDLIPYIREFARRHSSSATGLMTEFDKVRRLYQEHQSGIHDKLIEIMSGRASTHVNAMKKVDWDKAASDKQGAVNLYMETLTKETSTLHRVLSKHLPEGTVQAIMYPVFTSYREQWGKAYKDVGVKTQAAKERMLRDVEFFQAKLSKIDGAGDIGDYIVKIVRDKPVEQQRQPGPSAANPGVPARSEPSHDVNGETSVENQRQKG
ncbi:MAG: hypothetical protein M1827_000373 [Pycnora praestabilis]|nr:MAG: hypothetical protein M1827_000373 [Pycnora praestabilis]